MEFDSATVPTKSIVVRYFEEYLKPSIKVKINEDATPLNSYNKLETKIVKVKAKKSL